jgi:hypothetical protein
MGRTVFHVPIYGASIMHASELVKRCRDTVTPLQNLSLDKNDTPSSVANRSAARRRASRAPTMAAAAEIDTILSTHPPSPYLRPGGPLRIISFSSSSSELLAWSSLIPLGR